MDSPRCIDIDATRVARERALRADQTGLRPCANQSDVGGIDIDVTAAPEIQTVGDDLRLPLHVQRTAEVEVDASAVPTGHGSV